MKKASLVLIVLLVAVVLVSGCASSSSQQREFKTYGPFTIDCVLPGPGSDYRCRSTSDCSTVPSDGINSACKYFCRGEFRHSEVVSATGHKEGTFGNVKCECSGRETGLSIYA